MLRKNIFPWLCVFISFWLAGCDRESMDRFLNEETYEFSGTYSNQYNSDTLVFKDGTVIIASDSETKSAPYKVDGTNLIIQVRNNSKEKRPDLIMRIHGDGEVLTCNACAKYHLSNNWVKENYIPKVQPDIK